MNLLKKFTKKNLKLNKKRTTVTIMGIILSIAMLTALSSLIISFKGSLADYEKLRNGNYHVSFRDIEKEELTYFKNNRNIEKLYITSSLGYARIDESKNKDKPYAFIMEMSKGGFEGMGLVLKEGEYPKNNNEIVIPSHLKTNGRVTYNVGDTIKLNIGKRMVDGDELNQYNPFLYDEETIEDVEEIEYKIVGIIDRPTTHIEPYDAPGYTFITLLTKEKDNNYTAYTRFTKEALKDYEKTTADILEIDVELFKSVHDGKIFEKDVEEIDRLFDEYYKSLNKSPYSLGNIHSSLISVEGLRLDDPLVGSLYTVGIIVALIIIFTSVYCIKNSFDISITEKTKDYGMLSSIGATKKQIKKNVLYEAFILGIIGIPIGLVSGLFASSVLIALCNIMGKSAINIEITFKFSTIVLILSVILGIITIYLSAIKSARRASKISPINAIRNTSDIKIDKGKIKSPKIINKIFGIGGLVSYKNLKRNKKKYRTTVVSIIICVASFIALSTFVSLSFRVVKVQYNDVNYNLNIYASTINAEENNEIIENILKLDGIKSYSTINEFYYSIINPNFTKEYKEYLGEEILGTSNDWKITMCSLGKEEYKNYLKKLNLNYEDMKDKVIIVNNTVILEYDKGKAKKVELNAFDYKKEDKLKGVYYKDNNDTIEKNKVELDLKVGHITNERPLGLENPNIMLIVSDELMDSINQNKTRINMFINAENPDDLQDEIEKIIEKLDDANINNVDKQKREMKTLFTLVAIFLYGFITVIALIGITNIFNTITTNMNLRRPEFAMLKSIGMTKKEFNRMISLESLFYGLKSLIIGVPIGIGLSYLIYKVLINGMIVVSYELPISAIIISSFAVFILISIIMKFSINKINKQNIIETIRNNNI